MLDQDASLRDGRRLAAQLPTRVRYKVLALGCALAMITYMDRVCLGQAAPSIVKDLGLPSIASLRWAFAAFSLAYAPFEVPSGWMGDVFGPRKVLIRVALWWSFFVALTGVVGMRVGNYVLGGVGMLAVVQFLFGAGEAGAFPNITRALHNWFPYHQRGFAQGAVWMCARLMGGLTPLVFTVLVSGIPRPIKGPAGIVISQQFLQPLLSWRAVFAVFGLAGIVWCVVFALWFRNRPEEKSSVNAAELALIRAGKTDPQPVRAGIPWGRILASPDLWLLWLSYACLTYGWWFHITYLPNYLEQNYHVPAASLVAALQGWAVVHGRTGLHHRRVSHRLVYSPHGQSPLGPQALRRRRFRPHGPLLLVCATRPSAGLFCITIALAGFCTDLSMASSWATCQDIGGRYAAIVAGFMNMIGNLGGATAMWIFGVVLEYSRARMPRP